MDDLRLRNYEASPVREDVRSLLGSVLSADWRQAMIARGYGWLVQVGALTTPITGGGDGTVLDLEQPELAINCPSGYAMIPLRIAVQCQVGLQTTDAHETEIVIGLDRTQVQVAGTSTAESPGNMRTDITTACPFTCYSAYTADGNATPIITELARKQAVTDVQTAVGVNVYQFDLVYEPVNPPMLIGPGNISVWFGGGIATPGYIQASVLAFPATLLTRLG
jgi:hypothetical protein